MLLEHRLLAFFISFHSCVLHLRKTNKINVHKVLEIGSTELADDDDGKGSEGNFVFSTITVMENWWWIIMHGAHRVGWNKCIYRCPRLHESETFIMGSMCDNSPLRSHTKKKKMHEVWRGQGEENGKEGIRKLGPIKPLLV